MRRLLALAAGILFVLGCARQDRLSQTDLSYSYDPARPDYRGILSQVYHSSDSLSSVYLRLDRGLLLRLATGPEATSPVLRYYLFSSYSSHELIDSGHVIIPREEVVAESTPWFDLQLSIPSQALSVSMLRAEVEGTHLLKHVCSIDRSVPFGQQNMLLTDPAGEVLFSPVVSPGQEFRLAMPGHGSMTLIVKHYNRQFPVARPPFAFDKAPAFDEEPDNVFSLEMDAGISAVTAFEDPGIYHIIRREGDRMGKTLLVFAGSFPVVQEAAEMLPPLIYLTTSREFEQLLAEENTKVAVDKFWLGATGNIQRARLRVREYYSRVEEANALFTSYHEGWKTDRGIIYIAFGAPKVVYRTDATEKWIYGEPGNAMSLRFTFSHINNPFTLNDYSLNKSPVYKESWYNAVEAWRR